MYVSIFVFNLVFFVSGVGAKLQIRNHHYTLPIGGLKTKGHWCLIKSYLLNDSGLRGIEFEANVKNHAYCWSHRWKREQEFKRPKVQWSKDPKVQEAKRPLVQRSKDPKVQASTRAVVQRSKGVQGHKGEPNHNKPRMLLAPMISSSSLHQMDRPK